MEGRSLMFYDFDEMAGVGAMPQINRNLQRIRGFGAWLTPAAVAAAPLTTAELWQL